MQDNSSEEYSKPRVEEYGAVESITQQQDKIGSKDDGINFQQLDGSIVPDK